MKKYKVSLDEASAAWVDSEARRRRASASQVIREAVVIVSVTPLVRATQMLKGEK